ncbi:MAG TPA: M23 family metallopeptidase [Gaiellaceae bacterium]|nr:M23 family metallopeptidase [Gaiellaceae bacterium]
MRVRLALLALLGLLAFVPAGAGSDDRAPGAAASAWAIKITVPNQADTVTPTVSAPPAAAPAATAQFSYPADGSIVSAASTTASASTAVTTVAAAKAESDITQLVLFKGEITADAVTARASAGTGYSGAGGNVDGSTVLNLKFGGQPVTGPRVALADWGQLSVGTSAVDTSAPAGAKGYHTYVTELDVRLTADHDGLPAGSDIQIGYADASAQTAPPAPDTTTSATTTDEVPTTVDPTAGDSPSLRTRPSKKKSGPQPLYHVHPKLTAKHYVFPVYGASDYVDTFGAGRSDVSGDYHHGDDVFGTLGQPLVACTDGIVFSVGWNKVGGNRLWILDSQGNQFYYAHLSAFSTTAVNGAHVKAGEVIGFMGNTGDAQGTPYHLHFEVHPVSLLYLGYDGAVDPTPYLDAWKHQQDLPFPIAGGWAPAVPGGHAAPEPGAILLGVNDISTANGLDPASLERALTPVKPSELQQTIVPVKPPKAPATYPGRG